MKNFTILFKKMLDLVAALWYNIRGYLFFFFFWKNFHEFVKNFTILLLLFTWQEPETVIFFFNCEKIHEEKFWGKWKKWLTRRNFCGIMADGSVSADGTILLLLLRRWIYTPDGNQTERKKKTDYSVYINSANSSW